MSAPTNPRGISFSLTAPKAAKPQPPVVRPPSPGPQVEAVSASSRRAAAAAFFLSEKLVQVCKNMSIDVFWIRIRSDPKLLSRSGNHFASTAAAFFLGEKLVQVCNYCSLVVYGSVLDPDPRLLAEIIPDSGSSGFEMNMK